MNAELVVWGVIGLSALWLFLHALIWWADRRVAMLQAEFRIQEAERQARSHVRTVSRNQRDAA